MVYDELSYAFLRIARYCIVITTALKGKCSYSAAAAAKSLQSCPTLCDPIDGSPPGSNVTQKGTGTERLQFTQGHKSNKRQS